MVWFLRVTLPLNIVLKLLALVFIGFENAAVLGEETKNPKRNVGIAVLSSIGLTTAYMAFGCYGMIIGQGRYNLSFQC
jgi:amino acid transporter